jgi:hypothetical protein
MLYLFDYCVAPNNFDKNNTTIIFVSFLKSSNFMFLIHNPKAIFACFLIFFFLFVAQVIFFDYSYAHKLLESHVVDSEQDKDNTIFGSALRIPDHTVSWAIYQQLGGPDNVEARFYKFENKQPSSNLYV